MNLASRLTAASCLLLLGLAASCSQPVAPSLPGDNAQRYVDELDWFELAPLEDVQGSAGRAGWIADALSGQLAGRRLILPVSENMLGPGTADIQLEYDELPLLGHWSSPPGQLDLQGGQALILTTVRYAPDPASGSGSELISLYGRLQQGAAQTALQEALQSRVSQPLDQSNPETSELWLLGRSSGSLRLQWEFSGTLGGEPFSFTASQPLTAVSSYYEVTILDPTEASDPARLSSRHAQLLYGFD